MPETQSERDAHADAHWPPESPGADRRQYVTEDYAMLDDRPAPTSMLGTEPGLGNMNPRAWCNAAKGPCESGCLGSFCLRVALAPDDAERRVPHGFQIGVLVIFFSVAMAAILGCVVGMSLR